MNAQAAIAAVQRGEVHWRNASEYDAVRAALEKQTEMEAALRFVEQATEEVLELEEPPAEIADVATSAARAIRDTVCAALAAQPAEEEPRV